MPCMTESSPEKQAEYATKIEYQFFYCQHRWIALIGSSRCRACFGRYGFFKSVVPLSVTVLFHSKRNYDLKNYCMLCDSIVYSFIWW
jgi:hypothetical protein